MKSVSVRNVTLHSLILSIFFSVILANYSFAQQLQTLKGKVQDKGNPLVGVQVVNTSSKDKDGKLISTATNDKGEFQISAKVNDIIRFAYVGYSMSELKVSDFKDVTITLEESASISKVVVVGAVSQKSTWVGAKIGYNLDGISDDNSFIGAAKITMNPANRLFSSSYGPQLAIIGNFGDFISNSNKDSVQKKLTSLTQSVQGLSIGTGLVWDIPFTIGDWETKNIQFRPYLTGSYRLNTFTKVGTDSATVNLSQFRGSVGIEFEGIKFERGGVINLSIEGTFAAFSPDRYEKVFNERKKSLKVLETTVILPISNLIGFFVNGTFSKHTKAVYLIGIIVKPK